MVDAGFGSFHVLMLFYCGCAWAADATEMMLLSFLGPAVRRRPAWLCSNASLGRAGAMWAWPARDEPGCWTGVLQCNSLCRGGSRAVID